MNRIDRDFSAHERAKLKYLPGGYKVIAPGTFVVCAVTGKKIPLEDLRYWSVKRQEAYSSPDVSLERERAEN